MSLASALMRKPGRHARNVGNGVPTFCITLTMALISAALMLLEAPELLLR
jgi:hypothetical protein